MKLVPTLRVILSILILVSSQLTNAQIQLEGLYATSTALPLEEFAVENVFDQDPNTFWKTPQGSGPNEGIMVYFSSPTYISRIEAEFFINEEISEVSSIEVYGDGNSFWNGKHIDRELSFLYIKIGRAEQTEIVKSKIGDMQYVRRRFSEKHSIAIKELLLYQDESTPYQILSPKFVKGQIEASSSLTPQLAYGPANLMDSRKDLGWAENIKGNGIGESITFTSEETIQITDLKIWNGYQRSPKHFSGNARLKSFLFGLKGRELKEYQLLDKEGSQLVDLGTSLEGREFILKIIDTYNGDKYQDLVLSEIKFFNNEIPIIIKTAAEENRIKELQSKSQLTQSFLDKNFSVRLNKSTTKESEKEYYAEYIWESRSLSLRSNNTFVLYTRESLSIEEYNEETNYENYEDDTKEVIADGNWELKEEGSDYIKIRIFGKIYSPTSTAELYHGDVSSDNVRIFQDFLTLTKDKISGERFVEDIILKN